MDSMSKEQAQRIIDLGGTPTGDLVYDIMLEASLLFPLEEKNG